MLGWCGLDGGGSVDWDGVGCIGWDGVRYVGWIEKDLWVGMV